MKSDRDHDELLLTAFRYAAGELTGAESSQFETLLADDLPAQQALADAVLLGDGLARSTVVVQPRSGTRAAPQQRGRIGAVLAVVAVALLVVVLLRPDSSGVRDRSLAGSPDRSVLDVWSDLADSETVEQVAVADFGNEADDGAAVEAEDIPDWLLHAVAGTLPPGDETPPGPAPDEAPPTDEIDEAT